MTRSEYVEAVNKIIAHDNIVARIRDVSQSLAKEVGDDFGGLAIIPETPLRQLAIELIEAAAGDSDKHTSYFLDGCMGMKDGGSVTFPDGTRLPISNAHECYTVIEYSVM